MSQAPSRTRIAAPGTTSGGRNEDSSRRNPQETFMNHPLRTADDTKMEIGARMRPGVPNGTGTAASHPPELVARFERDAMPFLSKLYTVATLLIRERAAAEDLVQETYLRAFTEFGSFAGTTGLKAWLFRILADTALGASGQLQRPPLATSPTGQRSGRTPGEQRPTLPPSPMPTTLTLEQLPEHEVKTALRRLPRTHAIAVYLADVEDFSHKEIAEILGISPSTAASRLHQGRQRLLMLLTTTARRQGLVD